MKPSAYAYMHSIYVCTYRMHVPSAEKGKRQTGLRVYNICALISSLPGCPLHLEPQIQRGALPQLTFQCKLLILRCHVASPQRGCWDATLVLQGMRETIQRWGESI